MSHIIALVIPLSRTSPALNTKLPSKEEKLFVMAFPGGAPPAWLLWLELRWLVSVAWAEMAGNPEQCRQHIWAILRSGKPKFGNLTRIET